MGAELLFLLGYPLAIFANFSTSFLNNYFDSFNKDVLKKLFLKSFFKSIDKNKKEANRINKIHIQNFKKVISKDKNQLFEILESFITESNSSIEVFRNDDSINQLASIIYEKFDFPHKSITIEILRDCLNYYETSFYSEITKDKGILFLLKLVNKLNSEVIKSKDISRLRKEFINELDIESHKVEIIERIKILLKKEINDPESNDISEHLKKNFKELKLIIEKLTKDQYQIIHYIKHFHRAVISGCAGSGKTIVALEKAIRLSKAGIRTLLLTKNPFLSKQLKRLASPSQIEIYDFTNFIYSITNRNNVKLEKWNEYIEPLEHELNEAYEIIEKNNINYDAIIVDEGQDFKELWWVIIELLSINSNQKMLYIFHDDRQEITGFKSKFPLNQSPHPMSKNCRNAGEVFEIVKKFHFDAPITSEFLKGKGIYSLTKFKEDDSILDHLESIIKSIDENYKIDLLKIVTNEFTIDSSLLLNKEILVNEKGDWQTEVVGTLDFAKNEILKYLKDVDYSNPKVPYNFQSYEQAKQFYEKAIPKLSNSKLPTQHDIDLVIKCAELLKGVLIPKEKNSKTFIYKTIGYSSIIKNSLDRTNRRIVKPYVVDYLSDEWPKRLKIKRFKVVSPSENRKKNNNVTYIPLDTIESIKGLESEIVILFINTINKDILKELYIGSSRAVAYLHILIKESIYSKIQQLKS